MRSIVVIGGGPAGTFAAIAAKKQDPTAVVTLLTCEHCEPYEKPPLSKAVLLGSVSPEDALIAGPGGVAGHDVVLRTLAHCTRIDRAHRAVVVGDGRTIRYDALVIATEWEEFKKLDLERARKVLSHPIVFDGRNLFDPAEMERLGFIYKSIGR